MKSNINKRERWQAIQSNKQGWRFFWIFIAGVIAAICFFSVTIK